MRFGESRLQFDCALKKYLCLFVLFLFQQYRAEHAEHIYVARFPLQSLPAEGLSVIQPVGTKVAKNVVRRRSGITGHGNPSFGWTSLPC